MAISIEKAFMSFRICKDRWYSESKTTELISALKEYPDMVDDIALFTGNIHTPYTLEVFEHLADVLKERIPLFKKAGYGCGINILTTMGHHNENLEYGLQGNYTRRTDIHGNICLGSFCPGDDNFIKEFVIPVYIALAKANPDFIWIDDDVRSGHKGIGPDCFCDNCIAEFNKLTKEDYTRETLNKALNSGTKTEKLKIRKLWLQNKRNIFNDLFKIIEKTVHDINPDIALGFMTGERFADGYDFKTQAKILSGDIKQDVLWRPGGGFYSDDAPVEMLDKAHQVGRQVSLLPNSVLSIQSEIENFNYEKLKKSIHMNTTEIAAYIASGCTGAALNIMGEENPFVLKGNKRWGAINKYRKFYNFLAKTQGRLQPTGIYTGWNIDTDASKNLSGEWYGNALHNYDADYARLWFDIGLPVSYNKEYSTVAMFTKDSVYALSHKEIMDWLSKGIFIDGQALDTLNEMGYSKYTGFKVKEYIEVDCIEELVPHTINEGVTGNKRDGRQSFWPWPCASLIKTNPNAKTLAKGINYVDKIIADCIMGIYTNKLGGRICVSGYHPWYAILGYAKSMTGKRIMRWLSKDTLPAYISSHNKVTLWVRERDNKTKILTLCSASMDTQENVSVKIITDKDILVLTDKNMNKTHIKSSGKDGLYKTFKIPALEYWSIYLAEI